MMTQDQVSSSKLIQMLVGRVSKQRNHKGIRETWDHTFLDLGAEVILILKVKSGQETQDEENFTQQDLHHCNVYQHQVVALLARGSG